MPQEIDTSIFSKQHGHRVLVCIRGNCAPPELGNTLEACLLKLIRAHGLDDPTHPRHVTCRTVQCLGVCHSGPIVMVHPGAIRYQQVDERALEHIFQEHLLQGRPVKALMLPPLFS